MLQPAVGECPTHPEVVRFAGQHQVLEMRRALKWRKHHVSQDVLVPGCFLLLLCLLKMSTTQLEARLIVKQNVADDC